MIGALLVSPVAGKGVAVRITDSVAARLRNGLDRLEILRPDPNPASSMALARDAVDTGCDVLVALGGDGLAHLAVQACAGSRTALAVVPAGTGNDLARELMATTEPLATAELVAAELRAGRTRLIDLGRVSGGSWFATVLCAGFDSAVNERANALRWPRGPRRYDLAILTEMFRLRPWPLIVETPQDTLRLDAIMVSVGNGRYYGGGIPVCPTAVVDDGLLDVTIVGAAPRRDLVRLLPRLRTGRHVEHPAVSTLRAASVRLAGRNSWIAYADGERQIELPLSILCVPRALTVISIR